MVAFGTVAFCTVVFCEVIEASEGKR